MYSEILFFFFHLNKYRTLSTRERSGKSAIKGHPSTGCVLSKI